MPRFISGSWPTSRRAPRLGFLRSAEGAGARSIAAARAGATAASAVSLRQPFSPTVQPANQSADAGAVTAVVQSIGCAPTAAGDRITTVAEAIAAAHARRSRRWAMSFLPRSRAPSRGSPFSDARTRAAGRAHLLRQA